METIKKILGYTPLSDEKIELLKKASLFNGTGANGIFFDDLIDEIFSILEKLEIFDKYKSIKLRSDIKQLVLRHDIDIGFKIGFLKANIRLSYGLYKLLHIFGFKISFLISMGVFYSIHFTKTARKNYKNIA